MVRYAFIIVLAVMMFSEGESFAQTFTAPYDSLRSIRELYDASQISNEIFSLIGEDNFGDELQFISDDIERIALRPILQSLATWKDLQQVPTLSDLDIFRILKNPKDGSPLNSDILNSTRIFLKKKNSVAKKNISLRTRVVVDPAAHNLTAYQNGSYQGSPLKTMTRLVVKNDDILLSFVEAKDPGEPLYFDHLTGCFAIIHPLSITEDVSLSKLVLGDYSLSFGEGLLFSKGFAQRSGKEVILNPVSHSSGIQPYISSSSYRYFRGAASEITSGIFSLSGFFSERQIDATIDSNTITSISSTGYHRTTTELARKDQAQSSVTGAHIAITPYLENAFLEIGATGYGLNYDKPVIGKDSLSFSGQNHSMVSVETRGAFSFLALSGEFARMISDVGRKNAYAITIEGNPLEDWEFSLNYHDLPPNFISPFGSTFGIHSGTAQNERGWYLGSKYTLLPKMLSLFGSANFSQSQNLSRGILHYSDILFGGTYTFQSFPIWLTLQGRSYGKGSAFSIAGDSLSKKSLRLDLDADLSKSISASLRAELQRTYSLLDGTATGGYLFGIGIYYLPIHEVSFSSGIAFFNTDSYSSRFYSNEADLPGSVPFIALYGNGYRYYSQCSYDALRALTFSARVAETIYTPFLGSILFHKMTVGVQCDMAF